MFLEKFHTAFHLFLESSKKFTRSEKEHIHILFEKDIIKKIFNFAIIFFFWSFIAVWIDSLLFSKGIIHGVHEMMFHFDQFFPVIIFSLTNAVLKYIFIYFYLGKLNIIKPFEMVFGVIPYLGPFFILGILIGYEKTFLKALKDYLLMLKEKRKLKNLIKKKTKHMFSFF